MTLKQVKDIAKQKNIKTGNMKKEDVVRAIQRAEGNFECFGTAMSGFCDQYTCLWRVDCLK
jgi:hypothetical protein